MKRLLALIIIILAIGSGYWIYTNRTDPSIVQMPKVTATIEGTDFSLYAPNTPEGLQNGLSVFKELPQNEGMIFRGLPVGTQAFWMKDMKFNIDIIWVNKDNEIVHIVYDVSKDSYPTKFQNPATRPSAYVIEINAGLSEKHNIAPGSKVTIN